MDEIDSINSMLVACVKALGGSKVVGPTLWPELSVEDAQRKLLAALNDDRPEKLSPDQAFLIERMARDAGHHIAIEFRCKALSYSIPTPIEPEDEKAQLMRDFINAQNSLAEMLKKIGEVKL